MYFLDGFLFILIEDKFTGAGNYRLWKRFMEIYLVFKRKLGFVIGIIIRFTEDLLKIDLWDICNNIVIFLIYISVSEFIKKSVLFIDLFREFWLQLEKRFVLSNGFRKYRFSKDVYGLK